MTVPKTDSSGRIDGMPAADAESSTTAKPASPSLQRSRSADALQMSTLQGVRQGAGPSQPPLRRRSLDAVHRSTAGPAGQRPVHGAFFAPHASPTRPLAHTPPPAGHPQAPVQRAVPPTLPELSAGHLNRMTAWVTREIETSHGQALSADVRQSVRHRLETALRMLRATGMPEEQVEGWARGAYKKDFWVTLATGVFSQMGYLVGMETTLNRLPLPPSVTPNASALGALAGSYVGVLDIATTVAGRKAQDALVMRGLPSGMPAGVAAREPWAAIVNDALWNTADNVVKNLVRIVLPFVQAEVERRFQHSTDGLIDKTWCDQLDIGWDGIVGLGSGTLGHLRKLREGGSGVPYLATLFLQSPEDFTRLLNSTFKPAQAVPVPPQADAHEQAPQVNASMARQLTKEIAVPLAVIGIIVLHISMLFSRNDNIVTDGHRDVAADLAALEALQRVKPGVMAAKAASSTHQMAVMTFLINLLAPVFEMAVDHAIDFASAPRRPPIAWPQILKTSLPDAPPDGAPA